MRGLLCGRHRVVRWAAGFFAILAVQKQASQQLSDNLRRKHRLPASVRCRSPRASRREYITGEWTGGFRSAFGMVFEFRRESVRRLPPHRPLPAVPSGDFCPLRVRSVVGLRCRLERDSLRHVRAVLIL